MILKDYSLEMPRGKIIGIHGASGSGKSTLLKLLMRFWDVDRGAVKISGKMYGRLPRHSCGYGILCDPGDPAVP